MQKIFSLTADGINHDFSLIKGFKGFNRRKRFQNKVCNIYHVFFKKQLLLMSHYDKAPALISRRASDKIKENKNFIPVETNIHCQCLAYHFGGAAISIDNL